MDILTHFRSIEELTKMLSREQRLLSEMFEKRKLMKFPLGLAIDLVGGNEQRLRKLVDYGVRRRIPTAKPDIRIVCGNF